MPNLMVALPNIGGARCSTPRSLTHTELDCRAVTLPRRESRWNLQGCPETGKPISPLVGRSSPYCEDMCGSMADIQSAAAEIRRGKKKELEMCANAQRDGRPDEHRWRPLFNATKFGWRSLLYCCAVTLPRREGRWNLEGCPKLVNRSQPLVGPKFTILWGHVEDILLLNKFFSDCRYVPSLRRYSPTKLCDGAQMVIFGDFCVLCFQQAIQQVSDLHRKFALRPDHVWKCGRHPICGGWD